MFERITSLFKKESKTGRVVFNGNPQAQWSKRNYEAFSDEAYRKNVIAYQAISKTSRAVADIEWELVDKSDKVIDEHPALSIINNPNPQQSRFEFIEACVGYYRITGNCYIERTKVREEIRELYTLRPDRMKVIESETGLPKGYIYKVGQEKAIWESDPRTGDSDIRHVKTFHPLDDWYGLSPIEAGAYGVDQHTETMKHLQALLQNGASPSGALELDETASLTDDQFNRLKAEIEEKYSGAANAGRPMLLEGGLKWTAMGMTPQAMGIIDIKYSAARDISLALGVPPLLLNIQGDSTYNNYAEARLAFYEETVLPIAQHFVDEVNVWLKDQLGELKFRLKIDEIPAIAEKRLKLWEMADNSSDLTINEKREIKGYEPVTGGDTVYITSTMIPINFDADEAGEGTAEDADAASREAFGDEDADR
jgi:HK97 family phage portal protein